MTEHSEQLRTTLVDLHAQLAKTREIDPELRQLLAGLATDIERILAESNDAAVSAPDSAGILADQRESLMARLADTAREFEDTHPNLAGTIGGIIDALGQMGI